MKRLFLLLSVIFLMSGCYDDSALWESVNDHESRISKLEKLCNEMNANISSLKTIVEALQTNDYVTSVTPVTEGGKEVGYTITFSKSGSITIYHGKDGADGAPGADGEDGADGAPGADGKDGADGLTPVIGVRQDSDGVYYWTLNGEWLLDDSGNKIPTTGKDGADGEDGKDGVDGSDGAPGADGADGADGSDGQDGAPGQDGKDGITPQLKIEDGYWYVSYDNGASWTEVGKAVGENGKDGEDGADGDSFFRSVTQDDANVYFTLADGTVIALPKKVSLSIEFDSEDLVVMAPNSTRDIRYTVTSVLPDVEVEALSSGDVQAKVVPDETGESTGVIRVRIPGDSIDEYCKVVVLVSNGEKVIMRTLTFEEEAIEVVDEAKVTANAEGGEVELLYLSNVECEVVIPEEAKSWISVAPATKALQQRSVSLVLQPNTEYYRSATVTIKAIDGSLALEYVIEQDGDLGVKIAPTQIPDNEIWYTTTDGKPLSLYNDDFANNGFSDSEFNAKVISNEYSNGMGIITFESTVTEIRKQSFALKNTLKSIYLPSTINKIGASAFYKSCNLECVNINSSELSIDIEFGFESPFSACSKLSKFCGPLARDDGRCIVIGQELCCFAPYGLSEYITPHGIKTIKKGAFSRCKLESITISEGVEQIEEAAFSPYDYFTNGTPLKYVYLPISLKNIHNYAFIYNQNIEAFLGNSKFISDDNYSLIIENPSCGIAMIAFASGAGLAEYTIPEGVEYIESYAFYYAESLKVLNFPDSFVDKGSAAFEGTTNIETITGKYVLDDNRSMVIDSTLVMYAGAGLEKYTTPNEVKKLGYQVLGYNNSIKEYVISDEVTDVDDLGYIFNQCPNLETVTISARMQYLGYDPFLPNSDVTPNIKTIFCRAIVPPIVYHNIPEALYEFDNLTIYVPEESLEAYMSSPDWAPYRAYLKGYNYTDLPENDTYVSSDYSKDGVVTTLQTAIKGEGIDIVLMGDAYSDRQIADGTYKTDMEYIYNNLFTEEPYKSFKDYFNVHYVNVVSATEGYEYGNTALDTFFGDGTFVGGSDNACFDYALNAISENDMDEALIIVAMNSDNYAGTCYMYYPTYATGTYGSGPSVAYFPKGGDQETFAQLLHHEACGHGFAKLADEYAYEDMGTVPGDYAAQTAQQQNDWGWWKNVDFTNDPSQVRWSYFLEDERYQYDGLGCFEGGLTYWSGVWRPTENSIMRYNTGGFNAPSREAIWYRIHKLAYGDSWEYDYEDFVEYDAINRASSASAPQKSRGNYVERTFEPTAPPVIVNKSWREVK